MKFSNRIDFNNAVGILRSNDFNFPTSMDKGKGYFSADEHWLMIDFNVNMENAVLHLLNDIDYELEHKKPLEYVIFHQGGYLD